jgi:hypothetical protein
MTTTFTLTMGSLLHKVETIYLDYEIDGTRFFLVKFRTIDLANNQIILSIVKL